MNVATHLLADVFRGEVEAAIVVSNDSDLALPLTIARTLVPVGTVNPGTNPLAGACVDFLGAGRLVGHIVRLLAQSGKTQ